MIPAAPGMDNTPQSISPDGNSFGLEMPPEKPGMDDQEIIKLVEDTYEDYKHGRAPFEREWYRNVLFLMGNQWIIWDTLENKWRKKRLADWVPTPVTNKFASAGQRLVSVISRIEPNWEFTPSTSDSRDISAAEQCELAEQIICEENKIDEIRASMAPWLTYTGNCFLLSGVEPIAAKVDHTGYLSGEPNKEDEMPGVSDMNQPRQETGFETAGEMEPAPPPTGFKLFTDVVAPFETYLDQTIENLRDQTKILLINRRSKEYVHNLWGVDIDLVDTEAKLNYQETLGYITSDPYITNYLAGVGRIKRVNVKRLYVNPNDQYPEGLYAVVAGGKVLEKGVLPKTKEGDPFIPISSMKFDSVPGAAFGRTPLNDVVQKQVQRNKIESLVELIILRMASPIWLLPEGTVTQNVSGAPGAMWKYSLIGDKSSPPSRIPGEQVPSSVIQFIQSIDKDIEDLVSTFEALKGQSPYSGAPGVVIEQLIEQGMTRFGPTLRNIAEGYRQWMKHQLELFRVYGIVDKTVAKMGTASKWDIQSFKGADIAGVVNVRVESDSTVPRSAQVEIAKIINAINAKIVDVTDPMVKQKTLQKLKIEDLNSNIEEDIVFAVKENETMGAGQPVDVTPFLDNHVIHIYKHREFAMTDQAIPIRPLIVQHITKHHMMMDAEMNPAGPPPGAVPPGGPPKPGGPGGPGPGHVPPKGGHQGGPGGPEVNKKEGAGLNPAAAKPVTAPLPGNAV